MAYASSCSSARPAAVLVADDTAFPEELPLTLHGRDTDAQTCSLCWKRELPTVKHLLRRQTRRPTGETHGLRVSWRYDISADPHDVLRSDLQSGPLANRPCVLFGTR